MIIKYNFTTEIDKKGELCELCRLLRKLADYDKRITTIRITIELEANDRGGLAVLNSHYKIINSDRELKHY